MVRNRHVATYARRDIDVTGKNGKEPNICYGALRGATSSSRLTRRSMFATKIFFGPGAARVNAAALLVSVPRSGRRLNS